MPVLAPSTGYLIGDKTDLWWVIKYLLTIENIKKAGKCISPQNINATYINDLELPLDKVLDALHVFRPDRKSVV